MLPIHRRLLLLLLLVAVLVLVVVVSVPLVNSDVKATFTWSKNIDFQIIRIGVHSLSLSILLISHHSCDNSSSSSSILNSSRSSSRLVAVDFSERIASRRDDPLSAGYTIMSDTVAVSILRKHLHPSAASSLLVSSASVTKFKDRSLFLVFPVLIRIFCFFSIIFLCPFLPVRSQFTLNHKIITRSQIESQEPNKPTRNERTAIEEGR